MKKPTLDMTLKECLEKFPQLEKALYELIEECIYCEGFKGEPLKEVFKAHGLEPEKAIARLNSILEE